MPCTTLSSAQIKTLICPQDKKKILFFDTSFPGLVLEVRNSNRKSFYWKYQNHYGRTCYLRIGDAMLLSVSHAKEYIKQKQIELLLGNDPLKIKREQRAVITFSEFAHERYLPYARGYKRSWQSDVSYLKNHLLPAFGKKFLDEIQKEDVIQFHFEFIKNGYAAGTANRTIILLRYMYNLAIKWELPNIKHNPAKGIELLPDPPTKERFLDHTETYRLFHQVQQSDNPMLQYIVPMLILTGARRSEVLHMRWSDIDYEHKSWYIPVTKAGKPRYVPLSKQALLLLEQIPRYASCDWVFPNPKTLDPFISIFNSWNTARIRAGLKDVRMHDLRHSFASFLVNSGRSIYEVQNLLGHTQTKTTQRYAHLSKSTLSDAANSIPIEMNFQQCRLFN